MAGRRSAGERNPTRARSAFNESPAPKRLAALERGDALQSGSILSRHYADGSIPNPKLATNAGDARTQADNSITSNFDAATGGTVRSHLGPGSVGTRELLSHPTNNLLRPVTSDAARDNFLLPRHVADNSLPGSKVAGLPATKLSGTLPGSQVSALGDVPGQLGGSRLVDDSVGLTQLSNTLQGGAQNLFRFRTIGTFLGGNSEQASAANHSHSSGNEMSFDALPDTERRRFLAQRLASRRDQKRTKETDAPVSRAEFNRVASMVSTLAHILVDAPDLDAFERERLRRAGKWSQEVAYLEFRQYKRAGKHNVHIHQLDMKHNVEPHTDLAV